MERTSHAAAVPHIADIVEPVPQELVPLALRNSAAGLELFKEEFRAAQRLRSTEGIFIPEVLRTTHPPEKGPHDVSSNPAPSYVLPDSIKRPLSRKAMGPGHLNQPRLPGFAPARSGQHGAHWTEKLLNSPNADYVLSRQVKPDPVPKNASAASATPASPVSSTKQRPTSAVNSSLHARMGQGVRPMTANARSPPIAGAVGAGIAAQTQQQMKELIATQVLGQTMMSLTRGSKRSTSASRGVDGSTWPTSTGVTAHIVSPSRPLTSTKAGAAGVQEDPSGFIKEADDGEGLQGEPFSRPVSALPPKPRSPAATITTGAAPATASASPGTRSHAVRPAADAYTPICQEGLVETVASEAVHDMVHHMQAASASLRRYNLPPTSSAISPTATTFARKPRAPHKQDPRQVTPSERIANNYSPAVRGLSPRTLEAFIPGGIKPGAVGPLPIIRWNEIDEVQAELGCPEADGIITAARKHMTFMPLELFDNLEYEPCPDPEDWVALGRNTRGTPAETILYQLSSDKYSWVPCRVMRWDAPSRMFEVEFDEPSTAPAFTRQDSSGAFVTQGAAHAAGGLKRKLVKRLNLRFKSESVELFERRLADAKEARQEAEAELRAMFYLDAMDSGIQEVLATYDFHAALTAAAAQVKGLSGPVLEAVGRVLLQDLSDYYDRAVKKAIVSYRRLDALEEARLKVLRIPPLPPAKPVPHNGLLPVTPPLPSAAADVPGASPAYGPRLHGYQDLLGWAGTHLFVAQPLTLDALHHLEAIAAGIAAQPLWCLADLTPEYQVMVGQDGFSLHEAGMLPFPLAKFEALQHSHLRQVIRFIRMKLVEALNVTEDENLIRLLNNGQMCEEDEPRSPAHLSLLRMVRQRMANAVHTVLLQSAQLYADCLERYQLSPPAVLDNNRKYGGVPEVFVNGAFLRVRIEERAVMERLAREAAMRRAESKAMARALSRVTSEVQDASPAQPQPGNEPSAVTTAADSEIGQSTDHQQDDQGVQGVQGADGVQEAQAEQVDDVLSGGPEGGDEQQGYILVVPSPEEIADVAAGQLGDMFDNVAELEDVYVSPPYQPDPLCDFSAWRDDLELSASKQRVAAVVALGIDRALEVASMFEDAAAALDLSMGDLLQELKPMDTSLTKYATYISKFKAAGQAAQNATPTEVWTGLLVVDTTPVKESLDRKATDMVESLLSQLLDKSIETYDHVCTRCAAISQDVMAQAQDTQGVLDLKAKLTAAEAELDQLRAMIGAARERDVFRIAYRHAGSLDTRVAALALQAQCWPRDMQEVFNRAWRKVELEHHQFQADLKQKRTTLKADLQEVSQAVASYKNQKDATEQAEVAHTGRQLQSKLQELQDRASAINHEEGLFEWEKSEWPEIADLQKELEPYATLWHVASEFALQSEDWMFGNMQSLNPEMIDELVGEWYKRMQRLSKSLPSEEHRALADTTRAKLEEYKAYIPVITALCNPGMRGRHWDQLSKAVGTKIWPGEELQLQRLLKLNILQFMQPLQDISDAASREHSLERQLDKMHAEWAGIQLELSPWKDTGGFILKGSSMEEIQLLLDDHTIKSQAMQSSPAAAAFIDRIELWVKKLTSMQDIFTAWLLAQQKWMYLGPVYGSEEIAKQMPKERNEFTTADTKWRNIMRNVQRQPEVLQVTDTEHLLEDLNACNSSFHVIEKSLNAYLDSKKLLFPRFFFLSNDELIEILSEAKDPLNVQPFVKKIIEAVNCFEFNSKTEITGMTSIEGEHIPFDVPVETAGELNGVERWLLKAEEMMRQSLASITKTALEAYPRCAREKWILEWPGQIVIAVGQTYWTRAVTEAIKSGGTFGLKQLQEKNTAELLEEVKLVRGDLTSLQRATIGALVVVDVHARDVVGEMVVDKVSSEDDFSWQSRLRYYWESGALLVRMLNAECVYGYEYLGNSSRLVITPLTDRCYRTLLGAHHLNLGGAPAGPAGTGKTETTKDLAKAVAIQCVVFNCSDGLDYIAMGKFFKGLAASGAWACFDEFNRIELEVLSVVAQQVLTIQRAKAAGKKRFMFEGADLPLVHTCNVFITMNPGYAGRSELPDNLKALFRDVAMMVPDYAMISEIILYSYGYLDARSLAGKLVQTYRLCSEQLSRQDHYDYGMRAVMAVLRAAGNLKRKMPDDAEDVLMLRAITDVNLPKFLDEDVPLFRGILSDLFPGVSLPHMDYTSLTNALVTNARKQGLQPLPTFLEKIIQLYEMIVVRHGLMLVGQSFGMKTSAIRVLAAALGDMCAAKQGEFKVKFVTLNPKAVTLGQLYGQDDPVSKEWTDGVLAVAFRNAARDTSPDRKWLVLDGPVDAIWIENMNTVLDDNKKLCLNSGEIIAMQGLMNLIFEVADLAVASPATVSRCGMVYVQPSLLGWRPIVTSWMDTLPEKTITQKYRDTMLAMMEAVLPPLLRLVTKDCKQPVVMQDINLVQSMVRLYQALIQNLITPPGPPLPGAPPATDKPVVINDGQAAVESCLVFAMIWGVCGTVDEAGRALVNTHFRSFLKGEYGPYSSWVPEGAVKLGPLKKQLPADGSVYDWVYEVGSGTWKGWMDTVPEQKLSPDAEYSQIIVSTMDVVRYTFLVSTLVAAHQPMLVVGPTGTGKSAYIKAHLSQGLDRKTWTSATFNFSAQTSANVTQDIIDGKLDKRRKGVYGPALGKHAVVFVDDLNMPQVEKYGAQPPIELLRQFMDHGGWFDRTDNSFRKLVDVQFIAAMGPPGGGRNPVTNRYTRHFNVLHVNEFDDTSKTQIFSALVTWWLNRCKFSEEFMSLKNALVTASLDVYTTVIKELLPTPAKTHYLFNLRDLSKVFQGMSAAGQDIMTDTSKFVRLWAHEVLRVFHDRLIDDADRAWMCDLVMRKIEDTLRMKPAQVMAQLLPSGVKEVSAAHLRTLLWADFMIPGAEPAKYDEISSMGRMNEVVTEYLQQYNAASKKPLALVLFQFALEHVARIARIIKQPGGHALLVGVGGSGRQSLTQLAAFMQDFNVMSVEITATYTTSGLNNNWHGDLKKALRYVGEKRKPAVFLFSDSQIIDETMVEDISNLLNTGEVPNLFDTGEVIAIGEAVRTRAKAVGMDGSRADLFAFFVQEVRRNLHVVLCFSPVGDAFRERLRKFPSLVTCTTIDWFTQWPDDALKSVAEQAVSDLELGSELGAKLSQQCMRFHTATRALSERFRKDFRRYFYVTPTSYLQLLESFKGLLLRKREEVAAAQRRYEVGLEKLASTEGQVQGMQAELEALQPQLIASSAETEELMVVITQQTAEADKVKVVVQADEAVAKEEAAKVKAIKDECEADLAEALPAFNAALKALDTLTKNDISEVKGMKSPPGPVRLVMEAVCILKGLKPTKVKDPQTGKMVNDYWETSKKMLSDMGFLDSLRTYDKDNIAPEIIEALKPLLTHPDFQPDKIKKVSQAAYGLCSWVRAMEVYNRVAKVVRPKQEKLAEAQTALAGVHQALMAKQAELQQVKDKLEELGASLDAAKAKKDSLQAGVALCQEKLDRAQKLIGGLGGEKVRWTAAAADLAAQYERLVGDMLLASGMIAYLGAFPGDLRQQTLSGWVKEMGEVGIPCSPSFSFITALGDPVKMRQWAVWGLPRDDVSAANGIVVHNSKRWPLCIDPQGQANKWIRAMEASRRLVVLKPSTDPNYIRPLQAALPLGTPVLLEGLGEALDASLEPVLLRMTFKQSGVLCVKLGDGVVEWSPEFSLYMTTKLRNPHYPPEVCTRVCLLNFCITPVGLEDQLLGVVVAKERPDLEEDKARLILQGAENARKLKEVEDRILQVLSSSQGNILDDGEAVDILQASKKISDEISAKQKDAERTEQAIDRARTGYAPIATHASTLFFCVAELANIDPMYQYSLTYFLSLFVRSIEDSPKANSLPKRLEALREHFTFFLYTNVCRSLFEKDKLLFAFSLATAVASAEGKVARAQVRFLLTGALSMDNPHPNPASEWLSDQSWSHLCELDGLAPPFAGLRDSITQHAAAWRKYYDTPSPHTQPLPAGYGADLDTFQKLLILRCILPDKLIPAIQAYVSDALGARYVEPQTFRLDTVFADSAAAVPLIFVLSFGSDPMADLLRFADERGKQVETVSLGQGQGPIAEKCIDQAVKEGFWVVLQNCHLAKSFLPRLEVICEKTLGGEGPGGAVHPEFRLWLTSYPSPDFPQSILENGLKITNEQPKGLKAGLQRIYKSDPMTDASFFDGCGQEDVFKNMLMSLAFFHCVVAGRRLYGPVGWNIPYTFNENDLRISLRQLRMFLDEAAVAHAPPPLAMLSYTAGECNYGGKVTDGKDRRTLMVLLSCFYNEDVVVGGADLAPGAAPPGSAASAYKLPEPGDQASYLSWIQGLPPLESPQVFGLHDNALVTRDLQDTRQLLDSLLLTQAQDAGGGSAAGARSPEDIVFAAAGDILDKLPPNFDIEAAQAKYPVVYLNSMNTVLVQELGRFNNLLTVIRNSLQELRKAVRGLVVMSATLESVAASLLSGKVPELWLTRSFPSLKPLGPYVREVCDRCDFFNDWLTNGPPVVFWISGFFFTQAFLTGAKQNYARKHHVPIDLIDFDFEVKDGPKDCDARPEDGVLVRGLFLEAAAWDKHNHCLCESAPKVLFAPVPPMLFKPAKLMEFSQAPHYLAPLYKTSERRGVLSTTGHSTNFVMDIRLPSRHPQSHWVMRGCAALTSLDA